MPTSLNRIANTASTRITTVIEVTTNGADEHIDALAKKYMGVDTYPMRTEGEVRLKIKIRTDRITMQTPNL